MLSRQILGVILAMALVTGSLGMLDAISAHVGHGGAVIQNELIQLGPFPGLDKGSVRLVP